MLFVYHFCVNNLSSILCGVNRYIQNHFIFSWIFWGEALGFERQNRNLPVTGYRYGDFQPPNEYSLNLLCVKDLRRVAFAN